MAAVFVLFVAMLAPASAGIFDSMYCGRDNCYEIMGLKREATKREINKAYRKLARELHPDQNDAPDANEKFQMLVAAYETLRNEVSRADYDYLLDNPDVYYEHFYRFFSHSTPKVDVAPILVVCLVVTSVLHYLHKQSSYNRALNYALHVPFYRNQAKQLADEEGLLNKKFFKGMTKDEQKAQENKILRDIIESKLDIKGGYQKPEWTDILAFQLLMAPFNIGKFLHFHIRRICKYTIMRQDPDQDEKEYQTRTTVGLSSTQWELISDEKKMVLLKKELWHNINKQAYKEERAEAERIARASNTRAKQMRRMARKEKVPENFNDD